MSDIGLLFSERIKDPAVRAELEQLVPALQQATTNFSLGTWNPILQFGGNNVGLLVSAASGYYAKAGQVVLFQFTLALSAKGASAGSAKVIGLPFLAAYDGGGFSFTHANLAGITGWPFALISANKGSLFLVHGAAGAVNSTTSLTEANFNNNSSIEVMGAFITAS